MNNPLIRNSSIYAKGRPYTLLIFVEYNFIDELDGAAVAIGYVSITNAYVEITSQTEKL